MPRAGLTVDPRKRQVLDELRVMLVGMRKAAVSDEWYASVLRSCLANGPCAVAADARLDALIVRRNTAADNMFGQKNRVQYDRELAAIDATDLARSIAALVLAVRTVENMGAYDIRLATEGVYRFGQGNPRDIGFFDEAASDIRTADLRARRRRREDEFLPPAWQGENYRMLLARRKALRDDTRRQEDAAR